ncbi:MAG: molybdopterin-dependent oxidoreductase [Alphaproteobacteria bacterium]|nr:molybdopterin-dependent oxidoreductase [Alphaproteobacteria bacterium]
MQKFGIGQPVRRTEDVRFVTGRGAYTDDLNLPGQAHGYVLRSPYAHARVKSIDTEAAKQAPGVIAVYTCADLDAAGIKDIPCFAGGFIKNKDGSGIFAPGRPSLARDRLMYVGDGIAFVVAETVNQAKDAAELIEVDVEDLPAAANLKDAVAEGAPTLYDGAPGNLAFDWEMGDADSTGQAFAAAKHVSRIDLVHNRIATNAMEPRAAIGEFSTAEDRYVLRTCTQGANGMQAGIAGGVFGIDPSKLRVVTPDVGGGFGMKTFIYPEHVLVLFAAKALGRPVKWNGERIESFTSDTGGRDMLTHAELAIDENNRVTAFRVVNQANMGGYMSMNGPFIPTIAHARILGGVYNIPSVYVNVLGYMSNSVPVDAYRGAGRPEAAYIIERAMDQAARELGLAPDEFRRINFVKPEQMPYQHPFGFVFDSGEFERNMEDAKRNARWAAIGERKAAANGRGKLRGIGMAYYIETTLGMPTEAAEILFLDDDSVEIVTGTMSNGQGHETAWAQVVSEQLGVPFEKIRLVQGDTDRVKSGQGTGGSHSLYMAAGAFQETSKVVVDKGKIIASLMLDEDKDKIDFEEGLFRVPGTNKSVGIMEVAAKARRANELDLPAETKEMFVNGLNSAAKYKYNNSTFPNGCHICEVEVDPETGKVDILAYTVVDDFGRLVNPLLVAGQVHGGVVQGIGQALTEDVLYDSESGQLITGSFMDYGMPRADDICDIDFTYNEIPCKTNPYGIKGCGEAGTIGACPSLMNAIVDALQPYGITAMDMPATPLKIWNAVQNAPRQAAE